MWKGREVGLGNVDHRLNEIVDYTMVVWDKLHKTL